MIIKAEMDSFSGRNFVRKDISGFLPLRVRPDRLLIINRHLQHMREIHVLIILFTKLQSVAPCIQILIIYILLQNREIASGRRVRAFINHMRIKLLRAALEILIHHNDLEMSVVGNIVFEGTGYDRAVFIHSIKSPPVITCGQDTVFIYCDLICFKNLGILPVIGLCQDQKIGRSIVLHLLRCQLHGKILCLAFDTRVLDLIHLRPVTHRVSQPDGREIVDIIPVVGRERKAVVLFAPQFLIIGLVVIGMIGRQTAAALQAAL